MIIDQSEVIEIVQTFNNALNYAYNHFGAHQKRENRIMHNRIRSCYNSKHLKIFYPQIM